jgi:hypothetical protein
MYGKKKALSYIRQTLKYSPERGKLIQFMVEWGFVPSKTALCDLIKCAESPASNIMEDDWKKRGRPKKQADCGAPPAKRAKKQGHPLSLCDDGHWDNEEYAKRKQSKCDLGGWMGQLDLCLFETYDEACDSRRREREIKSAHFKRVDICVHLGYKRGGESSPKPANGQPRSPSCARTGTVRRFYFNPQYFPCPTGWPPNHQSFDKLKSYIKHQSKKAGSLVVCNGGGSRKSHHRFKQFVCANAYRKCKEGEKRSRGRGRFCAQCRFGFKVRWDEHGYYIAVGKDHRSSGWHCCEPVPSISRDASFDVRMRKISAKSIEKMDMSVVK